MDFDFTFFLLVATVVTGVIWGAYALLRKQPDYSSSAGTLGEIAENHTASDEPLIVEYARSFFPIILIVLLLRSFLVEPFRIPSGSMMPTLLIGDFILVNKFKYGVRLPVVNTKILDFDEPQRGDIVVFRFPKDPTTDYIKRVVGVSGDRIAYFDKQVYVNGEKIKLTPLGPYVGVGQGRSMSGASLLEEKLDTIEHSILIRDRQPSFKEGEFIVPNGHYFVMGDNRDNSNDSRFWGTVPEENLVGKAFLIWMNWDWENSGIAFDRLGTVLK